MGSQGQSPNYAEVVALALSSTINLIQQQLQDTKTGRKASIPTKQTSH